VIDLTDQQGLRAPAKAEAFRRPPRRPGVVPPRWRGLQDQRSITRRLARRADAPFSDYEAD